MKIKTSIQRLNFFNNNFDDGWFAVAIQHVG